MHRTRDEEACLSKRRPVLRRASVTQQPRLFLLVSSAASYFRHHNIHRFVSRLLYSARQHLRSATRRFWWFRDAGSAHSVHGPSLWPARRFGTYYRTAWEIRILAGTASDVCWRRIYLHCSEAFSVY